MSRISYGNQGILGGPSDLGAPQIATELGSLGIGIVTTGVPSPEVQAPLEVFLPQEIVYGSLDGGKVVDKSAFSGISLASEANSIAINPIASQNQSLIRAMATLSSGVNSETSGKPSRYFIQPTSGHNWGVLHNHNAVDIANSCGAPVVAAAAGVVVVDPNFGSGAGGWNGGYGNFILVEHPNGTKTRYAHLSTIAVAAGDRVEQGQEIGKVGSTGHVEGLTGCHLHFEVIGGTNPLGK